MNFENVYWDREGLIRYSTTAAYLAVGDSWFWYPLPAGSLIPQIGRRFRPSGLNTDERLAPALRRAGLI